MAPLQKASSGRMEKGSSIWMPTSSMPKRKKEMRNSAGMVAWPIQVWIVTDESTYCPA